MSAAPPPSRGHFGHCVGIREFNGTDGEVGLHFGETAQVSSCHHQPSIVSPFYRSPQYRPTPLIEFGVVSWRRRTGRVGSGRLREPQGPISGIIVPDHYLVEIDDSSNEWVKPKQLFVALNNAKATQYNHLNVYCRPLAMTALGASCSSAIRAESTATTTASRASPTCGLWRT